MSQPTWPIISSINILLLNLRPGALQTIHNLYWGSGISKTDAFANLFADAASLFIEVPDRVTFDKNVNQLRKFTERQEHDGGAQFGPTSQYMNSARKRIARSFGIDSGSKFLMNDPQATVKNNRDKPSTHHHKCKQFTMSDHRRFVTIAKPENLGDYRYSFHFQEEHEQSIEAVHFLHNQRELKPDRLVEDLLDDFFAFRGPHWPSAAQIILASRKASNPSPLPRFESNDLMEKLKNNATIDLVEAAAAAAAAEAEAEAEVVPGASSSSSSSSSTAVPQESLAPVQESPIHTLFGQDVQNNNGILDVKEALVKLLHESGQVAVNAIQSSQQLSAAGIQTVGNDIFAALETIIITVACSSGYSVSRLRKDIYTPAKTLLNRLGMNGQLKGLESYLVSNHPVYMETLNNVVAEPSGGKKAGEGASLDLLKVAQKEFSEVSQIYSELTILRKLSPSLEEEPRAPMSVEYDSANKGMSAQQNVAGQISTTTAGIKFGGNGPIDLTGASVAPIGQWIGKDDYLHTDVQMLPHADVLNKLENDEVKLLNHQDVATRIDSHFALDGAATRGGMGTKGASSKNCLDFNPAANWMHKGLYENGICLSGLATYPYEKLWMLPMNRGKDTITLDDFGGVELKRPTIPLPLIKRTFQSCFHSVSTAAKYHMKVLFRLAHQLGSAHRLSKMIKNATGFSLAYNAAKCNGKDVVVLSGGLSAGMYIELLCSKYELIVDAICNGDNKVHASIAEQLTSIYSDFAINSTMVLLALPHEYKIHEHYLQSYLAREHAWQIKFGMILEYIYITPTMLNRKWVLALHLNEAVKTYGLNLPSYATEEAIEELHQDVHAVEPRIRAVSVPKKTKQMASSLAFMAVERYFRFRRAGSRIGYSLKNAKQKTKKIAKKRRAGVMFGCNSVYADKWAKKEFERLRRVGGVHAPAAHDNTMPEWIHPTQAEEQSEEIEIIEMMQRIQNEKQKQNSNDPNATQLNEPDSDVELNDANQLDDEAPVAVSEGSDGGDGNEDGSDDCMEIDSEEAEDLDAFDEEDEDLEINKLLTKKINKLIQQSGNNIAKTPDALATHVDAVVGVKVYKKKRMQILFGTKRIALQIGTKTNPQRVVVPANIINTIYIEDVGRAEKTIVIHDDTSSEDEDTESSSEEEESEEEEEDDSNNNTNKTSSSSSSSSTSQTSSKTTTTGKRKRKNTKKKRKKRKKRKIKKDAFARTRVVKITMDCLTPPHLEVGILEKKTADSGKISVRTSWKKSNDRQPSRCRVVFTIDTKGGGTRNKTQNKMIDGMNIFTHMNMPGDGFWQIELKKESPPEVEPTTDEVLWNQRKEDSTTKFKGMGLVSMMERKDDMGIQQLIDDLHKVDVDFYNWANGVKPLMYGKVEKCLCIGCGCQIVLPCFNEEHKYPDGAICPLWCKVVSEEDGSITELETHMRCSEIGIARHLLAVKKFQIDKLNGIGSDGGDESDENDESDEQEESDDSDESDY